MDLRIPATTTEARASTGMVQYYRDMWPRQSYVLSPPTESDSGPKGRKILWNKSLESSLKELNCMVSSEMLLICAHWKIIFIVHKDASDK